MEDYIFEEPSYLNLLVSRVNLIPLLSKIAAEKKTT